MQRTDKQTEIDLLKDRFGRMTSAVFVDFKGMNVDAVTRLRDELRKAKVEYRVVKNTLVRRALEGQKAVETLAGKLRGMTAVAWSFEEPGAAAKVLKELGRKNDKLKVKAGLIEGDVLDTRGVLEHLATMPGRDELRAMLLATLQAPLQQFLQLLSAPTQNLVYLLKAREGEQEKAQ
jgi:large subunit ribosomal protein L10